MELYLEQFLDYMKQRKKCSESTITSYRRDIVNFFHYVKLMGLQKIEHINKTTIMGYSLKLSSDNKAKATISRNIAAIKSFFKYLLIQNIVNEDPSESVMSPKITKKMPEILSVEEVGTLLDAPNALNAKGIRDRAMLELLYATGMRVTELISLKVSDVNLPLEYVRCQSGRKERIIPLGKKSLQALALYMNGARQSLMKDDTDVLFLNYHGQEMTRQGFWKLIKLYAKQSIEKPDITPHTLRHSFACHLIKNGCDLESIQEMLGHADISSTQIYAKLSKNKLKDIYAKTHPRA